MVEKTLRREGWARGSRPPAKADVAAEGIQHNEWLGEKLWRAVYTGNIGKVSTLLNAGADPDCKDKYGMTLLMVAVERGDRGVARLLMDSGAEIDAVNEGGWSALRYAASRREPAYEIMEDILEHGGNVDIRNNFGETLLIQVSIQGNRKLGEFFIAHGADVNAEDNAGRRALDYAVMFRNEEVASLLKEHGAERAPKAVS
jgi:ankyrin repeat protein